MSIGFVCAEDNSALDEGSGEIAVEDSQSDVNILSASPEDGDSDSAQSDESNSGDKKDLDFIIYTLDEIYPWSWAYSDGDSGPGIDIWCFNEYEMTGNSTLYLDDEIIYEGQGEFPELIYDGTLWQHYNGKGNYTFKIVYSGDDNYNPVNESRSFYMAAYVCELEDNVLYLGLKSSVSGVLTVKANGRTILTEDLEGDYITQWYESEKVRRFALKGFDSGVNHIEVSFTSNWKLYSFNESFEYYYNGTSNKSFEYNYNGTSNGPVPNQDNNTNDSSTFHRDVRAENYSKAVGSVAAGNPLLVLALALSSAVLLPRRK